MSGIVGRNIKARRKALGWSQETLAFKANVGTKIVHMLEKKIRSPQKATLNLVAIALGCTVADLYMEEVAPCELS